MLPSIHAAHVISQVHGMTEAYCAIHVISGTIFRANPWALDPTMNLQMTAQLRGTVLCVDVQTIRHCAIHSSLAHQITTVSCQIPL